MDLEQIIEQLILEEDHHLISVKKLYKLVRDEKDEFEMALPEFLNFIGSNARFQLYESPFGEMVDSMKFESLAEHLEESGYYGGPYVSMAGQEVDMSDFVEMLADKVQHIINSLEQLYNMKKQTLGEDHQESLHVQSVLQRAYHIQDRLVTIHSRDMSSML